MAPRENETMLMQKFGVTNKERYGMLWYFLEWSITVVPNEIEDNSYAKFWGVNKIHYGLGENVN